MVTDWLAAASHLHVNMSINIMWLGYCAAVCWFIQLLVTAYFLCLCMSVC